MRNAGMRMRIMVAMVMLVAVTTIVVFSKSVVVRLINRIRSCPTWIKHNLVVGLWNLLGSQELEPSSTNIMTWMSGLDKAGTN